VACGGGSSGGGRAAARHSRRGGMEGAAVMAIANDEGAGSLQRV